MMRDKPGFPFEEGKREYSRLETILWPIIVIGFIAAIVYGVLFWM